LAYTQLISSLQRTKKISRKLMKMKKKVTNSVLNILHRLHSLLRTNEEGRTIRKTRLKKFRTKNKKLLIATKIVAIWYLLIISGSYLTTDTGAYFNDTEVIQNSFHASWDNDEWDNSSLEIKGTTAWADKCNVYTTIKNDGDEANTISTWRYYIYKFVDNEPIGDPVATGIVPTIPSGGVGEISDVVTENGEYKFTVRRPLGHPGNNNPDEDGYSYLGWSQLITVTQCGDSNNNPEQPTTPEPVQLPIGEVTSMNWNIQGNSGKITINWTNPTSTEFSHVRVYKEGQSIPFKDNVTDQLLNLEKEDTENTTIYRIITVDKSGIESPGIKITVSKTSVIVN
jgi:YqxM protein